MNFFDLHCDTAFDIYHKKLNLDSNNLSVNLDYFDNFERKAEIFAIWTNHKIPKCKAFEDFSTILEYLKLQIDKNSDRAVLCTDSETLLSDDTRLKIIPSVEGADLLENDIKRVEFLREKGIRVLTLAWKGENTSCGGYDTDVGLTDFGYRVIEECENMGIIIDVSHMSEKAFWEFANVARFPFFASHSNSAAICMHPRNISDTQLRTIVTGGGVVGVTLVGKHLSKALSENHSELDPKSVKEAFIKHVVHFAEKGCDKNVCIGSDFDGTPTLPGLENIEKMSSLVNYMKEHGASDTLINDIFYQNAFNFFANNF